MQFVFAEYDSEFEEVETELPDSDVEGDEQWPLMGYKPVTYFTSVEKDDIPLWKHMKGYVTVVSVGTITDASVPIQVGNPKCNALIHTEAATNVISEKLL